MTAPSPTTVMSVRRGVRARLRSGSRTSSPPGTRRWRNRAVAPAAGRAAVPGADRLDRGDGHGAPDREHPASTGSTTAAPLQHEQPGREGRARTRQREVVPEQALDQLGQADADRHREQRPQHADLQTERERPEREHARRGAECHADPDLAALRLDDPADEVERRQRGAEDQQDREGAVGLLVVGGVAVEDPRDDLVGASGDRRAAEPVLSRRSTAVDERAGATRTTSWLTRPGRRRPAARGGAAR